MARYEVPQDYRIALVATMPRSGTWFSFYFFEFLDVFLTGRGTLNTKLDLHVLHGLKLGKLHTHCICPGFAERYRAGHRAAWDALEFYTPAYNFGYERFIEGNEAVFDPRRNQALRIVFLYRNPLDQMVSFYRHIEKHRQLAARTFVDETGNERHFESLSHFIETAGIAAYIKQYFSYAAMAAGQGEHGPGNILMVPYERLLRDGDKSYARILDFLGFALDDDRARAAFAKARNASKVESLKVLEQAMPGALARDQSAAGETHMRGGEIGKWQTALGDRDLELISARLAQFDLCLDSFETL